MRVAAVQTTATQAQPHNLARAEALVDRVGGGVDLVVLPELFSLLAPRRAMVAAAEGLDGATMTWARDLARRHRVWLLAGSFPERSPDPQRYHNTSCLIRPDGTVQATYRKIHLFDNDVDGAAYRESAGVAAGADIVTAEVTTDTAETTVGLATCYDLRFPEQFRTLALRGAEVLLVPSAFTEVTGRAHWEPLLRARAIENQAYVVAADQWGTTGAGMECHGRSMIVDPWGEVLEVADDGEQVITATLDLDHIRDVRRRLPSLANRRPDVYG